MKAGVLYQPGCGNLYLSFGRRVLWRLLFLTLGERCDQLVLGRRNDGVFEERPRTAAVLIVLRNQHGLAGTNLAYRLPYLQQSWVG